MWRQNLNIIQTSALAWVYENTKEYKRGECKLKKLLIDQCAWKLDGSWIASNEMDAEASFPRSALLDVMAQMRSLLNSSAKILGGAPFARLDWRRKLYWMPLDEKIDAKGLLDKN